MAKATATFDANDSPIQAAFRRVDKSLLGLEKKFVSVGKFAAKLLALPAAAAGGLALGVGKVLDIGGDLSDLSARTGVAAGELAKLQQEFKNNGKAAEDVGPVINKMQKSLATGAGADTIAKLGLNLNDLKKQAPVDQFHAIGEALNRIDDPAQKSAAAMDIFGKSGGELLALFASGGFGDAAAQVGGQADLLSKDAALFDDVSDKLALAGLKVQGFFVGVADKVAPVLKPILDGLAGMDFSALGQQVGTIIANLVQAVSDGTIGEIFFTSLSIAFQNAGNVLVGIFVAIGDTILAILAIPFKNACTIFEILTTPDFWLGLGSALMGIAKGFIAMMLDGVALLLEKLSKVPGLGKLSGAAEAIREKAQGIRTSGQEDRSSASGLLGPVLEKAKQNTAKALQDVLDAPGKGYATGSKVFDTSGDQSRLDGIWAGVANNVQAVSEKALKDAAPAKSGLPGLDVDMGSGKSAVSALQKIGGTSGGVGGDPLLSETKTTNGLLRDIRAALKSDGGRPGSRVAVFGAA